MVLQILIQNIAINNSPQVSVLNQNKFSFQITNAIVPHAIFPNPIRCVSECLRSILT